MKNEDLDAIIELLAKHAQRATYGAVAGLVERIPRSLMQGLEKSPRNSWVVSAATGLPTDYEPAHVDPRLQQSSSVLATSEALGKWLEVYSVTEPYSLWDCLHDAELHGLTSDPMARTVTVIADTEHLWKLAGADPTPSVRLTMHGVVEALARSWENWPGPLPVLKDLPIAEQNVLVREYKAKGRTVSISWNELEVALASDSLSLLDATFSAVDPGVMLQAKGEYCETGAYYYFEIRGERLECERTDGVETSLVDFVRLGERYWENFASESKSVEDR